MIHFTIGYCDIDTTVRALKKYAHESYHRYHKNNKFRHLVSDVDRYPNLKITDDIFSMQIWIMTPYGEEQRIFLDGSVLLDKLKVNSVSVEGTDFNEEVHAEFEKVLKGLSSLGDGCIYTEVQQFPVRYQRGAINEYPSLLDEIFNSLPTGKQNEHQLVFEALKSSFTIQDSY